MAAKTQTVAFRLDEMAFLRLLERATSGGVSVHEIARRMVTDGLAVEPSEADLAEAKIPDPCQAFRADLDVIRNLAAGAREQAIGARADVSTLSTDLAVFVETILVTSRLLTPDEAKTFVAQKFSKS